MAIHSSEKQTREGSDSVMNSHDCRREARVEDCHACGYEICESSGGDGAAIQQGPVFTINRSAHGLLLLMGEKPWENQVIQVYSVRLGWRRSTMLYHVRWTRALLVSPQRELYLVGCRLTMDRLP